MATTVGSNRIVLAALICSGLLAIAKFAASATTGASALMAEAVHSLIAAASLAMLMQGRGQAQTGGKRPGDLYFWTFVVAILLYATGAGVAIRDGVDKLTRTASPPADMTTALGLLGVASAVTLAMLVIHVRALRSVAGAKPLLTLLREDRDPSNITVLIELCAAVAGNVVAGVGIIAVAHGAGDHADGIATVTIGLILGLIAALFAIEMKRVLDGALMRPVTLDRGPGAEPAGATLASTRAGSPTATRDAQPALGLAEKLALTDKAANDATAAAITRSADNAKAGENRKSRKKRRR